MVPECGARPTELATPMQEHQLPGSTHHHINKAIQEGYVTPLHSSTGERTSRSSAGATSCGSSDGSSTSVDTSPTLPPGNDCTPRGTLRGAGMPDRSGRSRFAQKHEGMMVDLDLNRHRAPAPRFSDPQLPPNHNDEKARLVPSASTRAWRAVSAGEHSGSCSQASGRFPTEMGAEHWQQRSSFDAATRGGGGDSSDCIEEGMLRSAAPRGYPLREKQQSPAPRRFDCMDGEERLEHRYPSAHATKYHRRRVGGDPGVTPPGSRRSFSPPSRYSPPPEPLEGGSVETARDGAERHAEDDSDRDSAILMMSMSMSMREKKSKSEGGDETCSGRSISPPICTSAGAGAGARLR